VHFDLPLLGKLWLWQGFLDSIPGYDADPETQYLRNSDRPEPISQPEPEPNRNYIYKIWTETGTENISEPKQEPKQEPKMNLKGI